MNAFGGNFLKLFICYFVVVLLAFPDFSQADPACRQSFNVNPGKTVPANIALFGGMGCQELESFRGKFYIEGLSHISSHTFDDFERWKAVRAKVVLELAQSEQRLEEARRDDSSETAKNIAIAGAVYAVTQGLTVAGCALPTVVTCLAGLSINSVSTAFSLTSSNYTVNVDRVKQESKLLREHLNDIDSLSSGVLSEMEKKYLGSFSDLCEIVKDNCL